jgi:hypothetical protein
MIGFDDIFNRQAASAYAAQERLKAMRNLKSARFPQRVERIWFRRDGSVPDFGIDDVFAIANVQ